MRVLVVVVGLTAQWTLPTGSSSRRGGTYNGVTIAEKMIINLSTELSRLTNF